MTASDGLGLLPSAVTFAIVFLAYIFGYKRGRRDGRKGAGVPDIPNIDDNQRPFCVAFSPYLPKQGDHLHYAAWVRTLDAPEVLFYQSDEGGWVHGDGPAGVGTALISGKLVGFRSVKAQVSQGFVSTLQTFAEDPNARVPDDFRRTCERMDEAAMVEVLEACGVTHRLLEWACPSRQEATPTADPGPLTAGRALEL